MKIASVFLAIIGYLVASRLLSGMIIRMGAQKAAKTYRIKYITKTLNLCLILLFLMLVLFTLGIEYAQVSLFLSSAFAVIGIALFAQWSILSNMTASLIIFFGFPYRVGDCIKVLDKDDDISGIIEEISLFHVIIRKGEDLITYPNSMILQKAVVKLKELPAEAPATEEPPAKKPPIEARPAQ